jgi:hypothetical protein
MTIIGGKRSLPFLARNWSSGLAHWQAMGAKLSSPQASGQLQGDILDFNHSPNGDVGGRPQKRRRLEQGPEALAAPPPTSTMPVSLPVLTNGTVPSLDKRLLPDNSARAEQTLRIEVLKLVHRDSSRVRVSDMFNSLAVPPSTKEITTTKARCKIIVTHDSARGPVTLHCQSQICNIKTAKSTAGPHRISRIYLPQPFRIPEANIMVLRDDDGAFDFADSYKVVVELEATDDENWPPPLDLGSPTNDADVFTRRPYPPRRWILSSTVADIYNRSRSSVALRVLKSPQDAVSTEYLMDIDVRWTTGYDTSASPKPLEKGVMPSITVFDPDHDLPAHARLNGTMPFGGYDALANGHAISVNQEDDEMDGETTPSRSLRTRGTNKVYNLKVLSDQAQGREKKRRKRGVFGSLEDGRVSYILPAEQVGLDSYRCVSCGYPHSSLLFLQAHLQACHPEYDFELRNTNRGIQFHVLHRYEFSTFSETYQMGRPIKAFNLNNFANGDISWIQSRFGPENDMVKQPPFARVIEVG